MAERYISAESMSEDNFGEKFSNTKGEIVYDARTRHGPWATMTQASFEAHGLGRLGTGWGQKYSRASSGELHKVEG